MTTDIISRAVTGLCVVVVLAIVGIVAMAIVDTGSDTALTALATLGGGASGAIAALLTSATVPGAIVGGRRATDPQGPHPPHPPDGSATAGGWVTHQEDG